MSKERIIQEGPGIKITESQGIIEVNDLSMQKFLINACKNISYEEMILKPRVLSDIGFKDEYKFITEEAYYNLHKDNKCSICMDLFNSPSVIKECGHIFCLDCIKSLLRSSSKTCPNCRDRLNRRGFREVDNVSKACKLCSNYYFIVKAIFPNSKSDDITRIINVQEERIKRINKEKIINPSFHKDQTVQPKIEVVNLLNKKRVNEEINDINNEDDLERDVLNNSNLSQGLQRLMQCKEVLPQNNLIKFKIVFEYWDVIRNLKFADLQMTLPNFKQMESDRCLHSRCDLFKFNLHYARNSIWCEKATDLISLEHYLKSKIFSRFFNEHGDSQLLFFKASSLNYRLNHNLLQPLFNKARSIVDIKEVNQDLTIVLVALSLNAKLSSSKL